MFSMGREKKKIVNVTISIGIIFSESVKGEGAWVYMEVYKLLINVPNFDFSLAG